MSTKTACYTALQNSSVKKRLTRESYGLGGENKEWSAITGVYIT